MKCIRCGTDSKYKDRTTSHACKQCGEQFAFEPKTDRWSVSDGLFQKVIADVSAKDTLFFTERQLYYEFCRRIIKKMPAAKVAGGVALGVVSTFGSVIFSVISGSFFPLALGACGIAAGVAIGMSAKRQNTTTTLAPIEFADFKNRYLIAWTGAHGKIEKLLDPAPRNAQPNASVPSDMGAYSFDRALVTGSRDIAAMLVANRFHFENNCAILSLDGYPEHALDTVMAMLQRNPKLTVFTVHSASYPGLRVASHLREDHWFPDRSIRIIDLGLRPQHAIKLKLIAQKENAGATDTSTTTPITSEEARWLSDGYFVDLAALRPARLMKAIYQGFARANRDLSTATTDDDGIIIFSDPGGAWVSDPSADVYASDSFG